MTDQTVGGDAVAPGEWRHIRKQLARADEMAVLGATMRQEVVDRPSLMPAQLAFIRYRQHGLARLPWLWQTLTIICVLLALGAVADAVFDRGPGRAMPVSAAIVLAASLTLSAGIWGFVVPQSFRRRSGQMALLRQRIERRYES
jgi:hypothetical protein